MLPKPMLDRWLICERTPICRLGNLVRIRHLRKTCAGPLGLREARRAPLLDPRTRQLGYVAGGRCSLLGTSGADRRHVLLHHRHGHCCGAFFEPVIVSGHYRRAAGRSNCTVLSSRAPRDVRAADSRPSLRRRRCHRHPWYAHTNASRSQSGSRRVESWSPGALWSQVWTPATTPHSPWLRQGTHRGRLRGIGRCRHGLGRRRGQRGGQRRPVESVSSRSRTAVEENIQVATRCTSGSATGTTSRWLATRARPSTRSPVPRRSTCSGSRAGTRESHGGPAGPGLPGSTREVVALANRLLARRQATGPAASAAGADCTAAQRASARCDAVRRRSRHLGPATPASTAPSDTRSHVWRMARS